MENAQSTVGTPAQATGAWVFFKLKKKSHSPCTITYRLFSAPPPPGRWHCNLRRTEVVYEFFKVSRGSRKTGRIKRVHSGICKLQRMQYPGIKSPDRWQEASLYPIYQAFLKENKKGGNIRLLIFLLDDRLDNSTTSPDLIGFPGCQEEKPFSS